MMSSQTSTRPRQNQYNNAQQAMDNLSNTLVRTMSFESFRRTEEQKISLSQGDREDLQLNKLSPCENSIDHQNQQAMNDDSSQSLIHTLSLESFRRLEKRRSLSFSQQDEEGKKSDHKIIRFDETSLPDSTRTTRTINSSSRKSGNDKTEGKKGPMIMTATGTNKNPDVKLPVKSIMLVRTLEESLKSTDNEHYQKVLETKRRRSRLNRRLDGMLKRVSSAPDILLSYRDIINSSRSRSIGVSRRSSFGISLDGDFDVGDDSSSLVSYTSTATGTSAFHNDSFRMSKSISYEKFDVTFNKITVRAYPMIAGDNPAVSEGPPVTIDWKHIQEEILDLDHFEEVRGKQLRNKIGMKIPVFMRQVILSEQGYSMWQINEVDKQAALIRKQRKKSRDDMDREENMKQNKFSFLRVFQEKEKHSRHKRKAKHASANNKIAKHCDDNGESGIDTDTEVTTPFTEPATCDSSDHQNLGYAKAKESDSESNDNKTIKYDDDNDDNNYYIMHKVEKKTHRSPTTTGFKNTMMCPTPFSFLLCSQTKSPFIDDDKNDDDSDYFSGAVTTFG